MSALGPWELLWAQLSNYIGLAVLQSFLEAVCGSPAHVWDKHRNKGPTYVIGDFTARIGKARGEEEDGLLFLVVVQDCP